MLLDIKNRQISDHDRVQITPRFLWSRSCHKWTFPFVDRATYAPLLGARIIPTTRLSNGPRPFSATHRVTNITAWKRIPSERIVADVLHKIVDRWWGDQTLISASTILPILSRKVCPNRPLPARASSRPFAAMQCDFSPEVRITHSRWMI